MAKSKRKFVCQECGASAPKWMGRCGQCGTWDSMVEELSVSKSSPIRTTLSGGSAVPLSEVSVGKKQRMVSGLTELDRVLGGGAVPGATILIGGEPGIGKSTLLLQSSGHLAERGHVVLYVTGEESPEQIKLRAERIGADHDSLFVYSETNLDLIRATIETLQPAVVVIDSIQTLHRPEILSAPGSVAQVRECAADLCAVVKGSGAVLMIVGHVTKDGAIAGPKVLEHLVDTVLYFEGERFQQYRILRSVKNRFGPANEIGIFEMRDSGLAQVDNPSVLFLQQRGERDPGSVITATAEGTRTLLVEIQALVTQAVFGTPNRRSSGIDRNRVSMLLAVLEKRCGLQLHDQDVFVNVVGGIRISEPAVDAAVAVAVASSFLNKPCPADTLVLGEVGLSGEIRAVNRLDARLAEAGKLGFKKAIVPKGYEPGPGAKGMDLQFVSNLADALQALQ